MTDLNSGLRHQGRAIPVARLVSLALHPFLVSPCAIVLLLRLERYGAGEAVLWAALCAALVPVPAIVHLRRKLARRQYSDSDVSVREERFGFYLFGTACLGVCYGVLRGLGAPPVLQAAMLSAMLAVLLAVLANRFWTKVSVHVGTLAGVTVALAHYSLPLGVAAGTMTAVVAWARLVLRQHTLTQAVAACVIAVTAVLVVFGLWSR